MRCSVARKLLALTMTSGLLAAATFVGAAPANAQNFPPISGSGSSWAANAVGSWVSNVQKFGWKVEYAPTGSSAGRTDFLNHSRDFAVSDIPFQQSPTDGSAPERPLAGSYAYMPIVAGGTAFMYNLTIAGKRVTNLRLSGDNIAKIFTGGLKKWNDPAIAADNPGLVLPAQTIVPVVRSDGSGSSAQFSLWMVNREAAIWNAYYQRLGKGATGGETSYWPYSNQDGFVGQPGDTGVAGYISQGYGDGAIGYVQYSYAKNAGFPVAKMLNSGGYYVEPTDTNVAVALLKAQINPDPDPAKYLTQDLTQVYSDTDPRTYPMSAYSYMILPLIAQGSFSTDKGATLASFSNYLLCQGQQAVGDLGYSPLPINLVQAGFDQIKRIPGALAQNTDLSKCNNPTFTTDGSNALANTAPQPAACDKQGPIQCETGTGGATASTPVKPAAKAAAPTTGAGAPVAPGAASVAAAATAQVDPETGLSSDTVGTGAGPLAEPVSLAAQATGWSGTQSVSVLAGALLVALFLAPPLLMRRLSTRRKS